MTRNEAEELLRKYVKSERMLDHSIASEAVLRALARRLGRDEERWGLAGLLHDIDIEVVGGDLSRHGLEAERILTDRIAVHRSRKRFFLHSFCDRFHLHARDFPVGIDKGRGHDQPGDRFTGGQGVL